MEKELAIKIIQIVLMIIEIIIYIKKWAAPSGNGAARLG